MRSLHVLFLLLAILSVGIAPPVVAQQDTAARIFLHHKKLNIIGNDHRKSKAGTINLEGCENACKAIPRCMAFSYRSDNRICYLKYEATHFEERISAISGILSTADSAISPPCSEEAYQTVKNSHTIEDYALFLRVCAKGTRSDKVKAKLKSLKETNAWQKASNLDSCSSYEKYLRGYTIRTGAHYRQASRLKKQKCGEEKRHQETQMWEVAMRRDACASYKNFLTAYPSRFGPYYSQASSQKRQKCAEEGRREEQSAWQNASSTDSCDSYKRFLIRYPSSSRASQARTRKIRKCPKPCNDRPICVVETYYSALGQNARKAIKIWRSTNAKKRSLINRVTDSSLNSRTLDQRSTDYQAFVNASVTMKSRGTRWQSWNVQVKLTNTSRGWKILKICNVYCRD